MTTRAMKALLAAPGRTASRLLPPDMLIPLLFGPRSPHPQGPPLTGQERRSTAS